MSDSTKSSLSSPEERAEKQAAGEAGKNGISRRGFLKGAGFTAAGTALLDGVQTFGREAAAAATPGVTVRCLSGCASMARNTPWISSRALHSPKLCASISE